MKRVFISILAAIILAPIAGQATVISKGPFGEMDKAEGKLLLADDASASEKGKEAEEGKESEEGKDPEEREPKI